MDYAQEPPYNAMTVSLTGTEADLLRLSGNNHNYVNVLNLGSDLMWVKAETNEYANLNVAPGADDCIPVFPQDTHKFHVGGTPSDQLYVGVLGTADDQVVIFGSNL